MKKLITRCICKRRRKKAIRFEEKVEYIFTLLRDKRELEQTSRSIQYLFENYRFFDYLLARFSKRKKKLPDYFVSVFYSACIEIFFYDNNIDSFTINNSLNLLKKSRFQFLKPFMHGLLSNILKKKEGLYQHFIKTAGLGEQYSHPDWLVNRWIKNFGRENTKKILEFNNTVPGLSLVVNRHKVSIEEYQGLLDAEQISFEKIEWIPELIHLRDSMDPKKLPGYREGFFWIQDQSSFLVTQLVASMNVDSILDVCSSPGGKLFTVYKLGARMISNDRALKKTKKILDNIIRLGFDQVQLCVSDGRNLPLKDKFDLVLVDVPCSGTGMINRKGAIRWNRQEKDIESLSRIQSELLRESSKFVNRSGYLLYSTCSIEPEENQEQIEKFLYNNPNFKLITNFPYSHDLIIQYHYKGQYFFSNPFSNHLNGAFAALLQYQ